MSGSSIGLFCDVPYDSPYVGRIHKELLDIRLCLFSRKDFIRIGRPHEGVSYHQTSEYNVRAGLYGFFKTNRRDKMTDGEYSANWWAYNY